jgi:DNA processing protein
MDRERLARLQLIRSQNVGPATFRLLIDRFGSAEIALEQLPELNTRAGGRKIRVCSKARAEQENEQLEKLSGTFVMLGDEDYPEGLSLLEHEPPVLAVLGHRHLLKKHSIGIVGTRNASAAALALTKTIAGEIENYIVVSGMALGVDKQAHQASLKSGTIAVLAGGVDVLYPPENEKLYQQIIEMGCVVSEMPLGEVPRARHFPRRNRIISGLSLAVVIVEAPMRSGAMITARTAAEQGRLVCAVPGNPLDPRTKGTNQLLRDGATLVESSEDILREVAPLTQLHLAETRNAYTPPPPLLTEPAQTDYEKLLDLLGPTSMPLDEIIRLSDLPAHFVNAIVADLEIAGRVHRDLGNKISILN